MDDMTLFEERFEERLRAFAGTGVQSVDSAAVARAVAAGHPKSAATRPAVRWLGGENHRPRLRPVIGPWRTRSMIGTVFGAVAAVVVLVVGGAFFMIPRGQPGIGGPSSTAGPSASPSQAAVAVPSPTPTPILWTEASLKEDWPAPVRPEPAGGAIVLPILLNVVSDAEGCCKIESGRHSDPTDDTGSDVISWADIRAVTFCGRACVQAWVPKPPDVDPTDQWIAYGLVADDDGDGAPDRRFGMDNMPVDATGDWPHCAWVTDLHTGQTVSCDRPDDECYNVPVPRQSICLDVISLVTSFPGRGGEQDGLSPAMLRFGGETTAGTKFGRLPGRFYAWASVIQDGRVVATDYAPDVGWLEPSPDAKP